jgi:mRNA-degrading endonuclease toxin of MazEF toxin-antitoxin module
VLRGLRSFHPEVQLNGEWSKVLCEKIKTVDARKLGEHVKHLGLDDVRAVDDALNLVLDPADSVGQRCSESFHHH